MAIRTLKRKIIIREYDFNKVREQVLSIDEGVLDSLYDRASFVPLSQHNLEKLKVEEILKGKPNIFKDINIDLKMPSLLIAQMRDYLYNTKYYDWRITVDEEGYLCVQARKNTPKSRLGWGVFEKDIKSRL